MCISFRVAFSTLLFSFRASILRCRENRSTPAMESGRLHHKQLPHLQLQVGLLGASKAGLQLGLLQLKLLPLAAQSVPRLREAALAHATRARQGLPSPLSSPYLAPPAAPYSEPAASPGPQQPWTGSRPAYWGRVPPPGLQARTINSHKQPPRAPSGLFPMRACPYMYMYISLPLTIFTHAITYCLC